MKLRKWKPLWSYDIDKTEKWLSEMAGNGYRLSGINRMTRMFSFENDHNDAVNYHISFAKHQHGLPLALSDAGWKPGISIGNWSILENHNQQISLTPSRDGLVTRNRLHALIWKVISIYYGIQLFLPIMFIIIILSSSGDIEIVSSPFWMITFLYFLQVIGVFVLTIMMTRSLREFEGKYYDMEIDTEMPTGKTFAKWKPNWMITPDLTEKWLEEMSLKGNHLVKVQATRFIFEKGEPKQIAYSLDFQWKTAPHYAEIHKSMGWRFIYQSSQMFLKTAIWAKAYEVDEDKPQLTYDADERKAQKKKVVVMQGSSMTFTFLLIGLVLWNLSKSAEYFDWSLYHYVMLALLSLAFIMHLYNLIRFVGCVRRNGH